MKNLRFSNFIFFFFLLFILFPSLTNADYVVTGSDVVERTLEGNKENGNAGDTAGGAVKIYLKDETTGNEITAYCKDPYVPGYTSKTGATYKKTAISADKKAGYESIFADTCGNEYAQVVATKKYAIESNDTYGSDEDIAELYANADEYYNGTSTGKSFDDIIKDASNAAKKANDKANSGYSSSQLKYAKIDGMVKITGPSKIMFDADPGVTCINKGDTEVNCKISDSCSPGSSYFVSAWLENSTSIPESLPGYTGDGTPGSNNSGTPESPTADSSCAPCEVQLFKTTGTNGVVQEFVACVESNGNSRNNGKSDGNGILDPAIPDAGTPDDEGGNDWIGDDFIFVELECPESTKTCKSYVDLEQGGTEICNKNGDTVITIEENFEEEDMLDLYDCVKDGVDVINQNVKATTSILGEENPYCDIYCSEKFTLDMPGPTSDYFDKTVMINSGTFFDIKGNITSNTNLTCLAQPNYEKLVNHINDLREDVKEAMNEYLKAEAQSNYYESNIAGTERCIDPKICVVTYEVDGVTQTRTEYCGCYEYEYYATYTITSDSTTLWDFNRGATSDGGQYTLGSLYTNSCTNTGKGSTQSEAHQKAAAACESKKIEIQKNGSAENVNDKKQKLEKMNAKLDETNKSSELSNMIKKWNDCYSWDYSRLNWNNNECNPTITFKYYDYEWGGVKDLIEGDITNPIRNNTTLINAGTLQEGTPDEPKNPLIDICNPASESCSNTKKTNETLKDFLVYRKGDFETKYTHNNLICNPYDPTQKMKVVQSEDQCENGTVFEGFPISIDTGSGEYWYEYTYENMGHYFDQGPCAGRLDNIADISYDKDDFNNMCKYGVNNCKNCGVECVNPNATSPCTLSFCDRRCKISCVGGGCILDFGTGFLATYRTISLNNPFPNGVGFFTDSKNGMLLAQAPLLALSFPGEDTGDVSSTIDFNKSNWQGSKADKALEEINAIKETMYAKPPAYRIKLTPSVIQKIKEYNNSSGYDYINLDGSFVDKTGYAVFESKFIKDYFISQATEDYEGDIATHSWTSYPTIKTEFIGPAFK